MELWQREHIRRHLPELIMNTNVDVLLLARLRSKGVLSEIDLQSLNIRGRSNGPHEKSKYLYDLLQTRTGGYDAILDALRESNQTGAYKILSRGIRKNQPEKQVSGEEDGVASSDDEIQIRLPGRHPIWLDEDSTFSSPVEGLSNVFRDSTSANIILISTISPVLTKTKLQDTMSRINISTQTLRYWKDTKTISYYLKKIFKKSVHDDTRILLLYDDEITKAAPRDKPNEKYMKSLHRRDMKNGINVVIAVPELPVTLEEYRKRYFSTLDSTTVTVLVDTFRWDQLSKEMQKELLKRQVFDQSQPVSLKTLCRSYVYENQANFQETLLRDELLVDLLINKEPPVIVRQTIPPVRGNYINRRIMPRKYISTSIFESSPEKEIIVFSGFERILQA